MRWSGRVDVDLATKRQAISLCEAAINRAYDPNAGETAKEHLNIIERDLDWIKAERGTDRNILSIDVIATLEEPRPERYWIVDGWAPKGRVTLMAGDGGTGKSLVAQQIATSVATGMRWIGQDVTRGKVMMFSTEDDKDELTIRHQDICRHLTATGHDLANNLRLVPRVGMENRLIEFDGDNGRLTPTWQALCRDLQNWRPDLLILDNAAQIFAGNENSRPQVTWFCGRLEYLCQAYGTTIILLEHQQSPRIRMLWLDRVECLR